MSIELYLGFLLAATIIILVPGPNVTLIIATSVTNGIRAGLMTVAGTTLAQIVQITMVVLGLSWLVESYGSAFEIIHWIGATYLVYLGVTTWRVASKPISNDTVEQKNLRKGLLIGLANPKSLTFFAAFFPQFINPALPTEPQFALLSVSYLILATFFDGCYAVAGGKGQRLLASGRSRLIFGRSAGITLTGGGIWLALGQKT